MGSGQALANYTFEQHRFDSTSGVITRGDAEIRLEPVIANLLSFFLANPDRVISRQELMEAVWTGKVVSDDTINRGISVLRQALNPENKTAFIRTIPKRGYEATFSDLKHIVGDEHIGAETNDAENLLDSSALEDSAQTESFPSKVRRYWQVALSLLLVILVPALLVTTLQEQQSDDKPVKVTVAVLPFENTSADSADAYLGEGISDTIISTLSKQSDLSVIAKTSSFALINQNLTISEIGERLGARYVLEGSTQISNGELRVNARLIDVSTQAQVWSSGFNGKASDIFSVQDDIAQSTLIAVVGATMGLEAAPYRPEFKAYQQVMLGQHAMADQSNTGYKKAVEHFSRAIELDQNYALAYVLLAEVRSLLNTTDPLIHKYDSRDGAESVQDLLQTALQKEPLLSEGHALKGSLLLKQRKLDDAEAALDKALSIDPNNVEALADKARLHIERNQIESAILQARSAVKLDPQDSSLHQLLASTLWRHGRAEEALSIIRRNIENNPNASHNYTLLSRWSLQLGEVFDAMHYAVSEWQLEPDDASKHWAVCLMHIQTWNEDDGIRCINALLTKHPEFFEARHWRLLITGEPSESIRLIQSQVEEHPNVLYHKLQLAERYYVAEQWQSAINLLSPLYPELLSDSPQVNADSIWAARTLAAALVMTNEADQSRAIAEAGLRFIEQSRKLQAGGFTTGTGDVDFLVLLDRVPEAVARLREALDQGWVFYSYIFFKEPIAGLGDAEAFLKLGAQQQSRMQAVQARIASELGPDLGF